MRVIPFVARRLVVPAVFRWFGLSGFAAGTVLAALRAFRRYRASKRLQPYSRPSAERGRGEHGAAGQYDIAPGETMKPNGVRDTVLEASMESFPASDPPAY